MAKFVSHNLTLEIRFMEMTSDGWLQYEILFLYNGESIIQDKLLKRNNDYWSARSYGAFKANDYERDSLIQVIQEALDSDEPQFWEPIEPDVVVAIYPHMIFPFMPTKWKLVSVSQSYLESVENHEILREAAGGRLATDPFTIIVFVDIYNFGEESGGYKGDGPALIMCPSRYELMQFMLELRQEYDAFCQQWEIKPKPESDDDGPIEPPDIPGMIWFEDPPDQPQ